MRAIFISYRRDDSEGQSGRLYDDLVRRFGDGAVFMDVVGIEPGRDFRKVIDKNVASCGVLLAVIGPSWLDAKDETGLRRLDNPMDFVRLETAAALKRDIPVVPVLVRGARMPKPEQLPDDLKELAYRNGMELTHARWDSDVEVLIKALQRHVGDEEAPPVDLKVESSPTATAALAAKPTSVSEVPSRSRRPVVGALAGVILAATVVGVFLYIRGQRNPSPVPPIIKAFSATPTEVTKGGEVRLRWEVANADDIRLEPFGQVPATGSSVDQPQQTTVYKLTATNRSGGKSGTFQEVIVNEAKPGMAEKKPAITTSHAIPNFAGTWELFESTLNGAQQEITRQVRITLTQNGNLVTEGTREMPINSAGTAEYKLFFAQSGQNKAHEVKTEAEADLVDTLTWSLDGPTLVYRATFHYKRQYFNHPPGTDVRVGRYRRVGPGSANM
jgi:hypothetical protein